MNFLVAFMFFIFSAFGVKANHSVDQVRTFDLDEGVYKVSFWGNNRIFELSKDSSVIPCLENAYKAKKEVVLDLDNESGNIKSCKFFGGSAWVAR